MCINHVRAFHNEVMSNTCSLTVVEECCCGGIVACR